ncbi:MAG: hypothetical protein ACP5RT_02230 [Candidatus Micrarchaeia archaeon]
MEKNKPIESDKKKKINPILIITSALFSGVIGIILIYAILSFIAVLNDDMSITESNKWYIISWIPAEFFILIFFVFAGIMLGIIITIILSVILFITSAVIYKSKLKRSH